MNLDYLQIHDMTAEQLFPHLFEFLDFEKMDGEGYRSATPPQHWHLTLDGDTWADVDLTEGDCGNQHRAANFVRALMWHAGQEGLVVKLALRVAGDYYDGVADRWVEPQWQAWMNNATSYGSSPEEALIRAYLKTRVSLPR